MDPTLPPWTPLPSIRNLRDAGGYATTTPGTSVRRGLLYRSAAPQQLTGDGVATFTALGIKAVFDLRSPKEILDHPAMPPLDYLPDVTYTPIAVFAGGWSPEAMLLRYQDYLSGTPLGNYIHILRALPGAMKPVIAHILAAPAAPVLIHCSAGKDRTGVMIALLLSLAGMPDQAVAEEYALTQVAMSVMMQTMGTRVREMGVFKTVEAQGLAVSDEMVWNLLSARPETMLGLLGVVREESGGVEEWFVKECGMAPDEVDRLKAALSVEDDGVAN